MYHIRQDLLYTTLILITFNKLPYSYDATIFINSNIKDLYFFNILSYKLIIILYWIELKNL